MSDADLTPAKRPRRRSYKAACAAFLLEANQTIADFEEKHRLERETALDALVKQDKLNTEKNAP